MSDARLSRFRKHFPIYVYQNISACLRDGQGVGATILLCCAIDTLARYASCDLSQKNNKKRFMEFVKAYFPPMYDPESFYAFVRCGLVHSFNMERRYVILCCKETWAQKLHLTVPPLPQCLARTVINPHNLFRHLKRAHLKLVDDLTANREMRKRFAKFYRRAPVMPQHFPKRIFVRWLQKRKQRPEESAEPGASPNGGPAMRPGNSGAGGGPPSVT